MIEQVTMHDLLEGDTLFRKWLQKNPPLKDYQVEEPWRLYVQRNSGGAWAKADFKTYAKAFKAFKICLPDNYDLTICSRLQAFQPPIVKDKGVKRYHHVGVPGMNSHHQWCPHCRRPTVFQVFYKHHALGTRIVKWEPRCTVCGIRQQAIRRYV